MLAHGLSAKAVLQEAVHNTDAILLRNQQTPLGRVSQRTTEHEMRLQVGPAVQQA